MAIRLKNFTLILLLLLSAIICTTTSEEDDEIENFDDDTNLDDDDELESSKLQPKSIPKITTSNELKGSITLTTLTLDKSLNDGNVWMIEFYAPWCSHCKAFAKNYEIVAQRVHSSPPSKTNKAGRVAKINGDEEKAMATRFNIIGYPSFFLVDGWSVYEYKGSRSVDGLVKYIQGGYKKDSPLPIWSSPMGPIGMIQASMFWISAKVLGIYDLLVERYELSPMIAAMCFAGGGIFLGLSTMIIIAVILSAKVKEE